MPHRTLPLVVLLLAALGASRPAAAQATIRSQGDLEALLTRYYLAPHPELIGPAIEFLGTSDALANESAAGPIGAFFFEIFAGNKARLPEWQAVIHRQPANVRTVLTQAVTLSSNPARLLSEPPSPGQNDVLWGAFFASGDRKYLTRLMEQLDHMGERKDLNLFVTAGSAKWSLASNARTHPVVKAAVKAALEAAKEPLATELRDVLTKPPARIREETVALIREQHAKGAW